MRPVLYTRGQGSLRDDRSTSRVRPQKPIGSAIRAHRAKSCLARTASEEMRHHITASSFDSMMQPFPRKSKVVSSPTGPRGLVSPSSSQYMSVPFNMPVCSVVPELSRRKWFNMPLTSILNPQSISDGTRGG
jgi:hypothetical protein